MKHDLVERYIYAVTRYLPLRIRDDVQQELEGLVADMLAERCEDIVPTEKDIRVVLTELGAPEELAARYSGDEQRALISGSYFLVYKRILKIVLPVSAAGIALASVVAFFLDWDATLSPLALSSQLLGLTFAGIIGGAVQAFAVITFIFAILERKKLIFNDGDLFSHLPPVPKAKERIKPFEPIAGMILCILMVIVFLGFPQIIGTWIDETGWIPVFTPSVIRGFWILIVLWAVLGIVRESVKLLEGQYTKRLALVAIVCDMLTAICVAAVFLHGEIVNPEFVGSIGVLFADVGEPGRLPIEVLSHFNLFFFGIVMFALILDASFTTARALKYNRKPSPIARSISQKG
jgi:hypothetical protein